jgi:hypothetical protein
MLLGVREVRERWVVDFVLVFDHISTLVELEIIIISVESFSAHLSSNPVAPSPFLSYSCRRRRKRIGYVFGRNQPPVFHLFVRLFSLISRRDLVVRLPLSWR